MKGQITMPGLPFLEKSSTTDAAFTMLSVTPVSSAN